MNKEKSVEYLGYGILSKFIRRFFHKSIHYLGGKVLNLINKIDFEQYKMIFGERDDDIYIATYPKSGTTLLQMVLYQLTTDGKLNFKHIYDVSPWTRNASFKKQRPIELPSPRVIKTHDFYKSFPKGTKGKFIYVYRNGMDVAVSHYNQQKNYNNINLKFDEFAKDFLKSKSWFRHTKGWFTNKRKFPVLYIKYENLVNNKREEIDRIIEFCDLSPEKKAIDRAIKYSDFKYMKKHETKFGDQHIESKKVYDQFIRVGESGEGKEMFNEKQEAQFTKLYSKIVEPLEQNVFTNKM